MNTVISQSSIKKGGSTTVLSNGSISYTKYTSGAVLNVSSGGSARNVTNSGGSISIDNGGTMTAIKNHVAEHITINGGTAFISSGANMNSSVISSGTIHVSSGGSITNTEADSGGIIINGGGVASGIVLHGSQSSPQLFGSLIIYSGGTADDIEITSRGTVYVSSGGIANNISTVSVGGNIRLYGDDSDPAIVSNVDLKNGILTINENAVLSNTNVGSASVSSVTMSGGTAWIYEKGIIENGIIIANGANSGKINVYSGGLADSIVVQSNGHIDVSGGIASNCSAISSGAFIEIADSNYGLIKNCSCENGGTIVIRDSGLDVYVGSGGTINIIKNSDDSISTIASGIMVHDGGNVMVSSGAKVINLDDEVSGTTVFSGGVVSNNAGHDLDGISIQGGDVFVSSESFAYNTIVNSGNLVIDSDGFASNTVLSGGTNGSNVQVGRMVVHGSAEDVYVYPERDFFVMSGGSASGIFMSGGSGIINSNGETSDVSIGPSGYLRISGSVESATVQGAGHLFIDGSGNYLSAIESGDIFVRTSACATNIYLSSGRMSVAGSATYVDDDYVSNYISVGSGGVLQSAQIKGLLVASNGGVISNATVFSGGRAHIQNGGIGSSIIISSGCSINISGGGVINSSFASLDGHINVYGGTVSNCSASGNNAFIAIIDNNSGIIENCNCYSGGTINVRNSGTSIIASSGGIINVIKNANSNINTIASGVFASGGYVNVSSGTTVTNITNNNGSATILTGASGIINSGFIANYITVTGNDSDNSSIGKLFVNSGGTVANAILISNGNIYVSNGAVASRTTVNGGHLQVNSGGSAINTTVNNRFLNLLADDAYASEVILNSAGKLQTYGSSIVENVTVNSGGMVAIRDSSIISSMTVSSGGNCTISSGGSAVNCVVANNSSAGSITLLSGANGINLTGNAANNSQVFVSEGANLHVSNGWVANRIAIEGSATVSSGGKIQNTMLQESGHLDIMSGASGLNVYVVNSDKTKYPFLQVFPGAILTTGWAGINGHIANVGGTLDHCSAIGSLGVLAELQGNYPTNYISACVCSNGGEIYVRNSAVSLTAGNSGHINVYSGICNGATINAGGVFTVFSGGTASNAVNSGGSVIVSSGGNLIMDAQHSLNGALVKGDDSDGTIYGKIVINGTCQNVTAVSNGQIHISSGATASNCIVNGGHMQVYSNASAIDITVHSKNLNLLAPGAYSLRAKFDSVGRGINYGLTTANSMTISSGGQVTVLSGGTATNTIIINDGSLLHISSGAIASNTICSNYGRLHLYENGSANQVDIRAGVGILRGDGKATNVRISSGGILYAWSKFVGDGVDIYSGGTCFLQFSGSLVKNVRVSHGAMCYASSGVVSSATITGNDTSVGYPILRTWSGGTAVNVVASKWAEAQAYTNGTLNYITLNSGGRILVYPNGKAYNITINNGGYGYFQSSGTGNLISQMTVSSGGAFNAYNGGTIQQLMVRVGGRVNVYSGGKVSGGNVYSANSGIVVSSGGTLTNVTGYGDSNINQVVVGSGGSFILNSGATCSCCHFSGGHAYIYGVMRNGTVVDSSIIEVKSGGSMASVQIKDTTLSKYAMANVSAGASCNDVAVGPNGHLGIVDGVANSCYASGSLSYIAEIAGYAHGHMNHCSCASKATMIVRNYADYCAVNNGGIMHVSEGAIATSITVNSGGTMVVSGYGSGVYPIIKSGGTVIVRNKGVVQSYSIEVGGTIIRE